MTFDLIFGLKKEMLIKNKILLLGIALGLISLWFGYNKICKAGIASIQQMKAQVPEENLKTDVLRRTEVLQNTIESYKGYFAKETDVLWLIDKVSSLAKKSGLEVISLSPRPVVSLSNFLYGNVSLTATGSFHQLGDFVSAIESSSEFMRVEDLSFKKDKEFLSADIVISTYFWKG